MIDHSTSEPSSCRGAANRRTSRPAALSQVLVLLGLALVTIWLASQRDQLAQYSGLGYPGIFLISLASNATLFLPIPAPLAAIAGGSLFDPVMVALFAGTGATLGELNGYVAGATGGALVSSGKTLARLEAWMTRFGLVTIVVLAAIPNPIFDCAGILAGMTGMPVSRFLAATWAGKLVKFLAFALLGVKLATFL